MNMRWIKLWLILARGDHRLRFATKERNGEIKKCLLENRKCLIKVDNNLSSERVGEHFFFSRNFLHCILSLPPSLCVCVGVWAALLLRILYGAWDVDVICDIHILLYQWNQSACKRIKYPISIFVCTKHKPYTEYTVLRQLCLAAFSIS